jgi:hypothetical protein
MWVNLRAIGSHPVIESYDIFEDVGAGKMDKFLALKDCIKQYLAI